MPRKVMLAPVGFEMDRVLEAQKFEPSNVWYIFRNPPVGADPVGRISMHFAEMVVKAVKAMPLQEHHLVEVRQSELLALVRSFAKVIREEVARDPEVEFVINSSGSTKIALCASAIVSSFCRSPVRLLYLQPETEVVLATLITADPAELHAARENYLSHGECRAPFTARYFPVIPFAPLTPMEQYILRDLAVSRERLTVSQLVPVIKGSSADPSRKDVVKTGWSVKALEHLHLVRVRKAGTTKAVTITPEGEAVAAALEMFSPNP